ncbi:universal stress protein [Alteromonas sp.]|uniref:universal stress protein n=1 Tax=Alteromonas sp. TaxID=232 RepID=UPI000B6D961C|nr:universal stress protein [Alteromonas sp.]MAI39025.1 universal stress protein UspA [Alteromonas sp.]OUX84615.1 MAG: universal stress protein UspA [Alteromonas sp. TMED35]|tara:strand:+ start:19732 stop:20715 length:984 start_codon:yes stop_codon:yes gene_type:complete
MKGHYKNILCVLGDSHRQDDTVAQALHIAKTHQANITIVLALEALPPNANMIMESFSYIESQQGMETQAQQWLTEQSKNWSQHYHADTEVLIGDQLINVVSYVVNNNIDLVIKRAEESFLDKLFGSLDMRLLRKCPCPVWVVDRKPKSQYKSVVAALDLNYHYPKHEVSVRQELNRDILRHASQIALLEFAQLHVVHVFDAVPENIARDGFITVDNDRMEHDLAKIFEERDNELALLLNELSDELDDDVLDFLKPQKHIVHGYPRREIAATAASVSADVVVMGTVARLGVPGFIMGGTAEETIHQLHCAVVGIKPSGFQTPISIEKK